jgi:hypothetical protein
MLGQDTLKKKRRQKFLIKKAEDKAILAKILKSYSPAE